MATKYIVMKAYTAAVDVPGKDRRRNEPKYWFDSEAEALALSGRLNRSVITWYALTSLPQERHHIATDAWSCWVMAGELSRVHAAILLGQSPDLPPPDLTPAA